jgi:hypothetical protein
MPPDIPRALSFGAHHAPRSTRGWRNRGVACPHLGRHKTGHAGEPEQLERPGSPVRDGPGGAYDEWGIGSKIGRMGRAQWDRPVPENFVPDLGIAPGD